MAAEPTLLWPERFARNVRVIELFAEGKTLREIGEAVGLTHVSVIQVLSAVGLSGMARDLERVKQLRKVTADLDARFERAVSAAKKRHAQVRGGQQKGAK